MGNFVFTVLASLLALTPLVFSPKSSELFEFPKLLIIYFGAALLLPLVLYKLRERKLFANPYFRFASIALLVFLGTQLIATIFSLDPHVSIFGYYSRFNGGLLSLASYSVLFFAAYFYLSRERVVKLVKFSLLVGLFVALWGLPSHFGRDFICLFVQGSFSTSCWTSDFIPQLRMFATLGQPNWFANYLLILLGINLIFLTTGRTLLNNKYDRYTKYIPLVTLLLLSIELLWTNSKSGILAYIVLMTLYYLAQHLVSKGRIIKNLKAVYYLPIVIVLIVFLSQVVPVAKNFVSARLNSTQKVAPLKLQQPAPKTEKSEEYHITPSSQIRLIVWQGAWELGQRYPLIGTGVETFAYAYYQTRPIAHNLTSEWNFVYNKAHNELLNFLATTGFLGLISYLVLWATFVYPAIVILLKNKAKDEDSTLQMQVSLGYLFALSGIFIMNFFGFSTTVTSLFTFLLPAFYFTYLYKVTEPAENKENKVLKSVTLNQLAVYFVWVLFAFVYFLNYFSADYSYARGREYKQISDFNNAYLYTQKAIDLRSEPTYLDQQAGISANLAALSQIQKQNPQVKQLTQIAKDYSQQSIERSPQNVFYYKTRAKVFYLLSLTSMHDPDLAANYSQESIKALEVAGSLAPTDPVIPYTLASLLTEQDLAKAIALTKHALELKPDYNEAKELLKQLQK